MPKVGGQHTLMPAVQRIGLVRLELTLVRLALVLAILVAGVAMLAVVFRSR